MTIITPPVESEKVTVVAGGRLEVRERLADHYHILVAGIPFFPTDVVSPFHARERVPQPTRHSLQVGESEHILLGPQYIEYINHSCDPNIIFDTDARLIKAVREVQPGEELVFFYPSTEWSLASQFACLCGSAHCVGRVAGASALAPAILQRYQLAHHIKRLLSVFPAVGAGSTA